MYMYFAGIWWNSYRSWDLGWKSVQMSLFKIRHKAMHVTTYYQHDNAIQENQFTRSNNNDSNDSSLLTDRAVHSAMSLVLWNNRFSDLLTSKLLLFESCEICHISGSAMRWYMTYLNGAWGVTRVAFARVRTDHSYTSGQTQRLWCLLKLNVRIFTHRSWYRVWII